jgi:hypothetical protein
VFKNIRNISAESLFGKKTKPVVAAIFLFFVMVKLFLSMVKLYVSAVGLSMRTVYFSSGVI